MILQHQPSNFVRAVFGVLLIIALAPIGLTDAAETPTLTTLAVIRGRVVDETGNPVAGALVRYMWFAYTQQDKTTTTDQDGCFAVEVESKYINPWGWLYAVSEDFTLTSTKRFQLNEGSLEIPETVITLKPGRVIIGTVVDHAGNPVEGATVAGADQTTRSNYVLTDENGKFRFSYGKEAGFSLQSVYAFKEGVGFDYLCTEESDIYQGITSPEKISDGPFQLTLSFIKPVELKVANETGDPLPGVKVSAWLITKEGEKDSFNTMGAPDFFESRTNAEGIATLHCLPEWAKDRTRYSAYGPQEGILQKDGTWAFYGGDDKRMEEFEEGQEIPTFVLPKQARVKGTVKLADGTPVPWTRITRGSYAACGHGIRFTDANGEFELQENANDKLNLAVDESRFGATPGVFAFDVGDGNPEKTLDFVIEKGIRLHGTVYGLDGQPANMEHSVFIYEKDPNPVVCDLDDEDCETCGTGDSIVIRQTSNYGDSVLDGKYEYILPAVKRDYSINASLYGAEGHTSHEFTLTGDETEYELDLYLKVEQEEQSEPEA